MEPSPEWRLADAFTIIQASCLWCDEQPPPGSGLFEVGKVLRNDKINAIHQMLVSALKAGKLVLVEKEGVLELLNHFAPAVVTRGSLIAFAKEKGQRPAFLFDTLLPKARNGAEPTSTTTPSKLLDPYKTNKAGRDRKSDWDGALFKFNLYLLEHGLPTQAKMIAHIDEWFSTSDLGGGPQTDEIKKWVSYIYNGMGKGGKLKLP